MGIKTQILQQLRGNSYLFSYATIFFKCVSLDDAFQTPNIIGMVKFGSTVVPLSSVKKFGHRLCFLRGAVFLCSCVVILLSVLLSV